MDDAAGDLARILADSEPPLEHVALAIAAVFREGPVDAQETLRAIDALADEARPLVRTAAGDPAGEARALATVLGERHGFSGDRDDYDAPRNSFLDEVVRRRRGLPILLSVLWIAVAERCGVELAGVGLPGHFVVAHTGASPPLVLDPFAGGGPYDGATPIALPIASAHDIALRMLGNLAAAYERRADPALALRAAKLRLLLPAEGALRRHLELDVRRLGAAFN
jgi:regulator of sirC expression with transglutaminase-like and TPR domain